MLAPNDIIASARINGRRSLHEFAGKLLLAHYGISAPRSVVVKGPKDLPACARHLAPPLAVKVMSPDIIHKSDVGGVRLHAQDVAAAMRAIEEMSALQGIAQSSIEGWLIEEMSAPGQELVVGAFNDARFGPMVMVGIGGVFVELLHDVAFRICPISLTDAREMLLSLKGLPLLEGARGREKVDQDAVIDALMKVGGPEGLMQQLPGQIAELDINPLIVGEKGACAVDARILLTEHPPARLETRSGAPRDDLPVLERFRPLFEPRTVAVVGASTKGAPMPNTFIRRMRAFGFTGDIYPIHPQASDIEGLPAFRSLAATPKPIDYAYIAIGAERIAPILAAAKDRVAFAQVVSSGFAEVNGGDALEQDLVARSHAAGVRIVGPNCLGTYSPRGGLTFPDDASREVGSIGLITQSGGLTTNMIKRGQFRGLRFSAAVTAGNCADIGSSDLLEYFLADPGTRAIGCYLEDLKDGRRFFELLRDAPNSKPVVLLRGGRSRQGRMAASSHTGALAADSAGWNALCAQTSCVEVTTLDEFVDTLLALQFLKLRPARPTRRVVLFGNGGGSSVLGADLLAQHGLDVDPFRPAVLKQLLALKLLPGSSVANPIDTPVATLQEQLGLVARQILDIVLEQGRPDAVALHLNMSSFSGRGGPDPIDNIFSFLAPLLEKHREGVHLLFALRTDDDPVLEERRRGYKEKARAIGIPLFNEIPELVKALGAIAHLETRLGAGASR